MRELAEGEVDENDGRVPVLPPTSSREPTETTGLDDVTRARIVALMDAYRAGLTPATGRKQRRLLALEQHAKVDGPGTAVDSDAPAAKRTGTQLAPAKASGERCGLTGRHGGPPTCARASRDGACARAAIGCSGTRCVNAASTLCLRHMCGKCCRAETKVAAAGTAPCVLHTPAGPSTQPPAPTEIVPTL